MEFWLILNVVIGILTLALFVMAAVGLKTLRLRIVALEQATEIHHGALSDHWTELEAHGKALEKLGSRRY